MSLIAPTESRRPAPASVARNVVWLGVGNAIVKPAWLLFVTAGCARVLGVEGYGAFISALALAQTGMAVADWGLTALATRQVARDPGEATDYFSNLMALRLLLSAASVGVVVLAARAIGWSGVQVESVLWAAAYCAGLQAVEHSRAYIRAFEVLRYEAVSTVVERTLTIAGGMAGLLWVRTVPATLLGMALGILLSLAGTSLWVHRSLIPFEVGRVRTGFLRMALRGALPIGVFGMVSMMILGVPPVLLERLVGPAEAGLYGAGYRLIDSGMLLPSVVAAALAPRLSALSAAGDWAAAREVVRRSFLWLAAGCLVVSLCLLAGAPLIATVLVGDAEGFGALPSVLRTAAALYPVMSFTFVTAVGLIAFDHASFAAAAVATALAVSTVALWTGLASASSPPLYTVWVLVAAYSCIAAACGWRLYRLLAPGRAAL